VEFREITNNFGVFERAVMISSLIPLSIARSKILSNDKDIKLSEVFEYYESINLKPAKGWAE
jgi:hypothetical protein